MQPSVYSSIGEADPALFELIAREVEFQATSINLIAAANYLSPRVRAAMEPRLQNIHCEGYPGKRYHEGQEFADAIEALAIDRAKLLFGAEHANVQPYRGTMANLAVAIAVMKPGETILGLECRAGGHYSTSTNLHCIGRLFRVVPYTICPRTMTLDYEAVAEIAVRERPRVIFCGDTAYPRKWDYARLAAIAREVGAVLIADISQIAGLIAGGALPNPVPYVDIATAATYKTLRGPRAGLILCRHAYSTLVDRAVYPVCQGGPNIMTLAGIAAALAEAATGSFRQYCRQVLLNAKELASELVRRGFDLITGGTDTHACLIDLRPKGLSGNLAAKRLAMANLICNGNQIPFDPCPPTKPSGLRFGTAAITTLGMSKADVAVIADYIMEAFAHIEDDTALANLASRVTAFRESFGDEDRSFNPAASPKYHPQANPDAELLLATTEDDN